MTKDEFIQLVHDSTMTELYAKRILDAAEKYYNSQHDGKPIVSRRLSADDMSQLIDRHIARMWGGLEMGSVEYFIKTGIVNGNFRLRLLAMLQFADWKMERLEKANGG